MNCLLSRGKVYCFFVGVSVSIDIRNKKGDVWVHALASTYNLFLSSLRLVVQMCYIGNSWHFGVTSEQCSFI